MSMPTTEQVALRCGHCDQPGTPYEHRGRQFSGLHANRGERLCSPCLHRAADRDGVDIQVTTRSCTYVLNTVRDADVVAPGNPEGVDGRDLAAHVRRGKRRQRRRPPPRLGRDEPAG